MDAFFTLLVTAILSEGIWEILKKLIPGKVKESLKNYINLIGSLAIGILIAFITDVNIFSMLNIDFNWHAVGVILTGILISRGSNYMHDIIKKLNLDEFEEK